MKRLILLLCVPVFVFAMDKSPSADISVRYNSDRSKITAADTFCLGVSVRTILVTKDRKTGKYQSLILDCDGEGFNILRPYKTIVNQLKEAIANFEAAEEKKCAQQ